MATSFRSASDKLAGLPSPGEGVGYVSDETRRAHEEALERAKSAPKDKEVEQVFIGGEIRAKWKIELTFVKKRSMKGLNAVGIQVWESGRHFHGGGDALAFFCKDGRPDHDDGCWGVIPQDNVARNGIAYCPHCKKAINSAFLTNMKGGMVYIDTLAKELAQLFRQLDSSADIFIKYHKEDPRYVAMFREKGPEVAKRLKGMHMYRLSAILKDTATGADLVGRFKAFLLS